MIDRLALIKKYIMIIKHNITLDFEDISKHPNKNPPLKIP